MGGAGGGVGGIKVRLQNNRFALEGVNLEQFYSFTVPSVRFVVFTRLTFGIMMLPRE
jgi:hypothetical protein